MGGEPKRHRVKHMLHFDSTREQTKAQKLKEKIKSALRHADPRQLLPGRRDKDKEIISAYGLSDAEA